MTTIVITDANVVINLIHVSQLDICEKLTGYEFVVPDHVHAEISAPGQLAAFNDAVTRGIFRIIPIIKIETITIFSELTTYLGRGESACLAMAIETGWSVASDEKRRFQRETEKRIGKDRLLGTADLFVLAIRAGVLTVEEADEAKSLLEKRRFKMPFGSFRDLI